ncbi:MAG: hypothetical protein PWQ67_469 [Clostridia bacterium]|jgi:diguanylate cyclase (GGDEF)-like protein|nr:hypothetical protein [Clostridia bacterium]
MNKKVLFILLLIVIIFLLNPPYLFAQDNKLSLRINEFMASNGETIADESGEFSDWIEIINLNNFPVDIGGYYISDHINEPLRWQIPEDFSSLTTIQPGQTLVLWADEKPNLGPLHLNFKLSKDGESITLTSIDKKTIIDKVEFGKQMRDISYGRKPDGIGEWGFFVDATPNAHNSTQQFNNLKSINYYLFYKKNKGFVLFIIIILTIILLLVLTVVIITLKKKRLNKQINYLKFHDRITGLYNRNFFEEELKRLDTERQLPISIIFADANYLKLFNDTFGHYEGDKLLIKIGNILKNSCRQEDIVARWGGDEFAILLPKTTEQIACEICGRINKACSEETESLIPVSIALGYATKSVLSQDINEVLKEAEQMMYQNKFHKRKMFYKLIITSLLNGLEKRVPNSKIHIKRLKRLILYVGSLLKLSKKQLHDLILIAQLQNIGKVVSDIKLKEEVKISVDEKQIMQEYPVLGYRLIKSIPELTHIAESILSVNECWDGTGYPQGLKGNKIPFYSRIISILNTYEAMTNSVNNKGEYKAKALEEIEKLAGKKYDPNLAAQIIDILKTKQDI